MRRLDGLIDGWGLTNESVNEWMGGKMDECMTERKSGLLIMIPWVITSLLLTYIINSNY